MFSRLDAIFKSNFLPLKEGDTYPGKKREDDEGGEKHPPSRRKNTVPEHSDFDNDRMVVSVATLLAFLNELTTAPDIKHDFSGLDKNLDKRQQSAPKKKISEETERAINAYRHTAEANNPPPPQKINARINRMLFHFDSQEKNLLTNLIQDLENLQKNGLRQIEIGNTESFFAAIIDAVTAAKEALK